MLLVACTPATPQTASPSGSTPLPTEASGADNLPSRTSLIKAAVDAGTIDQVTGLMYRAYGLFGLPGLPDEFAAGVPRADDALFAEMVEMMPALAPADQARFRPFLVRPTEPGDFRDVRGQHRHHMDRPHHRAVGAVVALDL